LGGKDRRGHAKIELEEVNREKGRNAGKKDKAFKRQASR